MEKECAEKQKERDAEIEWEFKLKKDEYNNYVKDVKQ